MLKVISGSAKGRTIYSIENKGQTRPLTGRIKESLFSILSSELVDAKILDVFSGSGSIGIEALSRGAKFCAFVEKDPKVCGVIRKNLERTDLLDKAKVICGDVLKVLAKENETINSSKVIFLDPPFKMVLLQPDKVSRIFDLISSSFDSGALIVFRRETQTDFSEINDCFKLLDSRKYGRNTIEFYELHNGDE